MLLRSRSHALAPRSRLARIGALCCLGALVVTSTGCFGTFPLTRTVYRENQEISDVEFHQTLAYWAMILTLVYPGAALTDMIVMNSIEFWKPEPASWEAAKAFVPVPADRYESMDIGPEPPAPVTAPLTTALDAKPVPAAPELSAPGLDVPAISAPGTPTIPLPLPALSPVFEESGLSASPRTLSRSDGPGSAY
jgi:hypothetical protein